MQEILNMIHKTIYQFFDTCEDAAEVPMSDKDKLLLEVNKAICNNLKALEQKSCGTIKEIPKDYKYDTETEDFLVYRHMYTGHEIHIEKPVPRYKLEQRSCEDCISRESALEILEDYAEDIESGNWGTAYSKARTSMCNLSSVEPERKTGKWVRHKTELGAYWCDQCGKRSANGGNYCPNCGSYNGGRQ